MSCTHDCGCTPEIRDARTDEWVQIAPESARPATLTPEQPVKAPGQGGDLLLPRETVVEVEWPNGNRVLGYVDEGGYQLVAGHVGNGSPLPWGDARIVRVLTEDRPAQEPVLPRQIKPGDYEVERVAATIHAAVTAAQAINVEAVYRSTGLNLSGGSHDFANIAWDAARAVVRDFDVWLIEDAPEPVDPDAEAVERMAKEVHDRNCADVGCRDWDGHGESTRKAWREDARVVIRNLRAQGFDVTARAEQ